MATRHISFGSLVNVLAYDDADFPDGISTDGKIQTSATPSENNDVLRKTDLEVGGSLNPKVNNIEIDGALNHDGSTVGLYAATPVTQAAAIAALTDSSGGTPDGDIEAVSGSGADAAINENFAELTTKLNEVLAVIRNLGAIAT